MPDIVLNVICMITLFTTILGSSHSSEASVIDEESEMLNAEYLFHSHKAPLKPTGLSRELALLLTTLLYFQRSTIHLMQRANSLEKTLMLGKTGGKRRSGQQRIK